jgi:hypothetical protein
MSKPLIVEVTQVAYHRNGISGVPFHAVLFVARVEGLTPGERRERFLASVFDEPGAVSLISLDRIATEGVTFGPNSWRGDQFEPELRAAISQFEETR